MKNVKTLIVTIVILIMLFNLRSNNVSGNAMEVLGVKSTIEDIISKFKTSMNSIIATAGNEARSTVLLASRSIEARIFNLKVAYQDSMEKTLEELSKQEQQLFYDVNTLLINFDTSVDNKLKQIHETQTEFSATLRDVVPGAGKKPIILSYLPLFIFPEKHGKTINIRVRGINLSTGKPYINISDKKFSATTQLDTELVFSVSRDSLFPPTKRVQQQPINLTVFQKGLFGKKSIEAPLHLTILPTKAGTYSLEALRVIEQKDVKSWTSDPNYIPPDWRRWESYPQPYTKIWDLVVTSLKDSDFAEKCYEPPDGWWFDVNSIKAEVHSNAWIITARDPAHNGCRHWLTSIEKNKACLKINSRPMHRDARAVIMGRVIGKVKTIVKQDIREEVASVEDINWNAADSYPLPENTTDIKVQYKLFNGMSNIVMASSQAKLPWIDVDFNPKSKTLIIRSELSE
ncbi:MAG: hypothetical protein GY797_22135 [Deltaproteobacteria bacterium]|nr:hypothetical protein [Deltaproteobacteria bacterium]